MSRNSDFDDNFQHLNFSKKSVISQNVNSESAYDGRLGPNSESAYDRRLVPMP